MPSVKVVEHENGDVSIGFESEGVFVPVSGISAARIGHYVERANDLSAKLEENPDDPRVLEAISNVPISASSSGSSSSSKASESKGGAS